MAISLSRVDVTELDYSAFPQVQDLPAMNLYFADWLTGTATQAMVNEQTGMFITLLGQAWRQSPPCSLPDDADVLTAYSRTGSKKRWEKVGALVRAQFVKCASDGRLRNPKQINVWLGMLDIRNKRSRSRFGESDETIASLCRDKRVSLSTPSIRREEETETAKASTGGVGGVAAEAAEAYRPLAKEWGSPGLTENNLRRLQKKVETVTTDLVTECDGFTWAELMRRARGQPYIHEQIRSFDFEWFLKREWQGTRLNAKKVWYEQFGSNNGDRSVSRGGSPEGPRDAGEGASGTSAVKLGTRSAVRPTLDSLGVKR